MERKDGGNLSCLRDWYKRKTGLTYLHPEECEAVQGFPITWTECDALETL